MLHLVTVTDLSDKYVWVLDLFINTTHTPTKPSSKATTTTSGEADPFVIIFVYLKNLIYTTPYGVAHFGIYMAHEHPFIMGGSNQPAFPINIQCQQSIANKVSCLMLAIVEDIYCQGIEQDLNEILNFLQSSEAFENVCTVMDLESHYFWAIILEKQVGVFCNEQSALTLWNMPTSLVNKHIQTHSSFAGAVFAIITHGQSPRQD
ncbi:hypothetical protein Moror_16560 [Moniliophthora roreri MCA 2997]|uniref:Uncharacterized protein n=1 Tax=Moniliophthora roreri (strain MCA 2997) TaxID=1381753 RepID=V2WLI1_MONRO|nr:hypothetical protein Moror_16560 [Moniliophthora roreri MCA 2997]